ncbi:hypothetical protein CU102_11955 [Phyllobacterium brassicacearum]|uniref:DUF423 domain-containing protein n=1 Tax=Phyllobacterium brassicacearum TaxID=314235 RepID=A0A2P7BPV9_9HYPH|nr:hypothetical protein [Phyllobacterium brassicacearum]PSH68486.1 hypothetical protein CU102_11955 [Phyllobacterium brassicacearum]TDQ19812.1 hypothetical protein DEV91_1244 [Phyllobacterium brassicacearum]
MDSHSTALMAAGVIGGGTAIAHGVLLRRLIIRRIDPLLVADGAILRRLIPPLLQFTTFNWLLSSFALIAAAMWSGDEVKLAVSFFAASSFLFGALGALWGTRRPHPSWILMTAALAMIIYGVVPAISPSS